MLLPPAALPPPPVITEWTLLDAPAMSRTEVEEATRANIPPHPPVPAPPPPAPEGKAVRVVGPDARGLVDLVAAQAPAIEPIPNPFAVRWHPPVGVRESALVISAVLVPSRPQDASVCINGKILSPGETVEGLTVAAISADTIELRSGSLRVLIPVGDRPLRLRQPRP